MLNKSVSWPCWLLLQVHQDFCLGSKTPHSPYSSWCKVCLDIRSPHSIQYPQKNFDESTYPSLPRSLKCYIVYTNASDDTKGSQVSQQYDGQELAVAFLSYTFIDSQKMGHYRTGSLWHLLCCNKVELLSSRIWHCCKQSPQTSTEICKRWK